MSKTPADLRSLARAHTAMGIKVLAGIASAEDAPPAARVAAVNALLDRGWGKPAQTHTGENGEGDIKVTIRHILEHIDDKPLVIDGRCVEIDTTVVSDDDTTE